MSVPLWQELDVTRRVFLGAVVSADWTEDNLASGRSARKSDTTGIVREVQWFLGVFTTDRQGLSLRAALGKRTTPGTSGRSPWLR
jgi:hypothetical protein